MANLEKTFVAHDPCSTGGVSVDEMSAAISTLTDRPVESARACLRERLRRLAARSTPATTQWRNCFHLRPGHDPDVNTERKMDPLAIAERRYDTMWAVVHSGNAIVHSVHRTKRAADQERRDHACAYVVVRVVVTPMYTADPHARAAALAFAVGRDIA